MVQSHFLSQEKKCNYGFVGNAGILLGKKKHNLVDIIDHNDHMSP
jgi:hypothetical protein